MKLFKTVSIGCFYLLWICMVLRAESPPSNIILCIGDGMGFEQVKAGRCYLGKPMSFELFPYQSSVITVSANSPVTDSAASGTAMASGIKVNNGVISMAMPGDGRELETLLEYYARQGKSTGLVTTCYMTHATPAVFAAHDPSRYNFADIASDYFNQTRPDLLLGGGGVGMSIEAAQAAGYQTVTNAAELHALDPENTTRISGQFGGYNLPYEFDGLNDLPHLSEMTRFALACLDNNEKGFFLMMEGGRIDHACHENNRERMVHEVLEFSRAVQEVYDWAADREDTLIIVTADHETGGLTVTADRGVGNYPDVTWSTWGHTGENVPIYAWGAGVEKIVTASGDPLDNTDIYKLLKYPASGQSGEAPMFTPTPGTGNPSSQVEYLWELLR
ncbi:MAG: alkaline phosphatase [bacterium]|jgi:alkaline phosphatase